MNSEEGLRSAHSSALIFRDLLLFLHTFFRTFTNALMDGQTTLNGKTKDSTINQTVAFKSSLHINLLAHKHYVPFDSFYYSLFLVFHRHAFRTIQMWFGLKFSVPSANKQMAFASREISLSVFARIHIFNGMKYARRFSFSWHETCVAPAKQEPCTKTMRIKYIYLFYS